MSHFVFTYFRYLGVTIVCLSLSCNENRPKNMTDDVVVNSESIVKKSGEQEAHAVIENVIAVDWSKVTDEVDLTVQQGKPLVVHVITVLCDNKYQGIVPVSETLGNGQDVNQNLYWGAMYGIRGFLPQRAGWKLVRRIRVSNNVILEKLVFQKFFVRHGRRVKVVLVAEAWDGRKMKSALRRFFLMASGRLNDSVTLPEGRVACGGSAKLLCFTGHNGLMDVTFNTTPKAVAGASARSAVVLACKSKPYFLPVLKQANVFPMVLITHYMAPEAYVVDSVVEAWAIGKPLRGVRYAAAEAYNKFQKCGIHGASRLFDLK